MLVYAFWNNKGGTGKTSLAFQAICRYANKHPRERVLAADICPQANLSELFLGGLLNNGSQNLLQLQGQNPRITVGGYFQLRLPTPYAIPQFTPEDFIANPSKFNPNIPDNIDLLCGDALLELQSNAINTLANQQVPGTNTWLSVVDWLRDYLNPLKGTYDVVFIDANPSFSFYTQIALSAADRLVLPVMADDSSRRAIQNAFSLVYGLKLPSPIYAQYAFATKLKSANRKLPRVHVVAKNRLTQYMGPASAYSAVLQSIESDVATQLKLHPKFFSFKRIKDGVVDIRDFQTTGVVAYAKGWPFYRMKTGRIDIGGQRVRVNQDYRQHCIDAIEALVDML